MIPTNDSTSTFGLQEQAIIDALNKIDNTMPGAEESLNLCKRNGSNGGLTDAKLARDSIQSPLLSPCPSLKISVKDNYTGKVNTPLVLFKRRCSEKICRHIKNIFSPSQSRNNIKAFGSKKRVAIERERFKTSDFVIHPLSKFRQFWDFVIMLIIFLNVFILPLDIAFFTDTHNSFLISSDVICFLDIVLNFRTGYRANPQHMEYELSGKVIAIHYVKSWFAVDLIGALPLSHIILTLHGVQQDTHMGVKGPTHAIIFMKILKLIQLLKLLRLSRIIRGISMYEEVYRVTTTFLRYIKLIVMMMMVSHWNGCLHFLVPMLQDFPDECWVRLCNLEGKAWYIQYGWALFKTLSHMLSIGYGRETPVLLSEALLTIFTMVTGATFYALFIAQSMAYMIECNYSKMSYMEKMKETDEYLSYRNIPDELKQRVLTYFNQKYIHRRYFNEEEVLSEISKPIRDDIIRYTCRDVINSIPYLKDTTPEFLSSILDMLSSDVYLPGDIIMHEGKIGSEIYFVRHGEVQITVQDKVIETLNDGDYFGECNALVEQERLYSARAIIPCDVLILSGNEFKKILEQHRPMRPLLEHGTVDRLIRIYNRCRLFNVDEDMLVSARAHDSTNQLYDLFRAYLEDLLGDSSINAENDNLLYPKKKQTEVERLLVIVVQAHRRSHEKCDITPSSMKEISDTNVPPVRYEAIDENMYL